jgi:hypothetical protein
MYTREFVVSFLALMVHSRTTLCSLVFEQTEHDYRENLRRLIRPTRKHVWPSANMLFHRARYRTHVCQLGFRLFYRLPGSGWTFCLARAFSYESRCCTTFDARERRPRAALGVVHPSPGRK